MEKRIKKTKIKGPWEFKIYYQKGTCMFKKKFCINDSSSNSQINLILLFRKLIDKEKECYIKIYVERH